MLGGKRQEHKELCWLLWFFRSASNWRKFLPSSVALLGMAFYINGKIITHNRAREMRDHSSCIFVCIVVALPKLQECSEQVVKKQEYGMPYSAMPGHCCTQSKN